MIVKVTRDHQKWCYMIGHITTPVSGPFPRLLPLQGHSRYSYWCYLICHMTSY